MPNDQEKLRNQVKITNDDVMVKMNQLRKKLGNTLFYWGEVMRLKESVERSTKPETISLLNEKLKETTDLQTKNENSRDTLTEKLKTEIGHLNTVYKLYRQSKAAITFNYTSNNNTKLPSMENLMNNSNLLTVYLF